MSVADFDHARAQFHEDLKKLSPHERSAFRKAVAALVEDLQRGEGFRASLRVKRVNGIKSWLVYELTWAPNGRATWEYAGDLHHGEAHLIWRRVGTYRIFDDP